MKFQVRVAVCNWTQFIIILGKNSGTTSDKLILETMMIRFIAAGMRCQPSMRNITLWWRHIERDGVSNHRRLDCLLNRLFRRRSKKTSKLRITGLWEGNPRWLVDFPHKRPVTRKCFHLMTTSCKRYAWPHYNAKYISFLTGYILGLPIR